MKDKSQVEEIMSSGLMTSDIPTPAGTAHLIDWFLVTTNKKFLSWLHKELQVSDRESMFIYTSFTEKYWKDSKALKST